MVEKKQFTGRRYPWTVSVVVVLSVWITTALLGWMLGNIGNAEPSRMENLNISEEFDTYVRSQINISSENLSDTERTFSLSDREMVAPKPNPEGYGQADDPDTLGWLLEEADELLDGQKTLFSEETEVMEGSTVSYYLDETIFAVTWKQVLDGGVYTFSEVKIRHPSQFRRFLSDNQYGSGKLYTTTEMSQTVNAVVSSSGDFYGYRSIGIVINNGQIFRCRGELLDTCYVDDQGDLLFTYAGEITDEETLRQYVEENHVRFCLSFGPVLIQAGEACVPSTYNSGEINEDYARAALCQLDHLHYLLVTANMENPYLSVPTVKEFAENLVEMGVPTAYALDGGQTAAIAMNSQLMNQVSYGSQRRISDIIYFATALPESSG